MDDTKQADDMEKKAKFTIIQMEDDKNEGSKSILEDAKKELTDMFAEFRDWVKTNVNAEETSKRLEKLKADSARLVETTKQKLDAFNAREDVRSGKEKLYEAGEKVADVVNEGIRDVMDNAYVAKTVDTISDTVNAIREDERVKKNVRKLKKGTLKAAEKAYEGLQRVLDTSDEDEDK